MHSLCTVLGHLRSEDENPDSLIHLAKGNRRKELEDHIQGCTQNLRCINAVLERFNSLTEDERNGRITGLYDGWDDACCAVVREREEVTRGSRG